MYYPWIDDCIIVGYKGYFESYYSNRQKEINSFLNYDSLHGLKDKLDKREYCVKEKEMLLNEREESLNKAIEKVFIDYIIKFEIAMDRLTEQFVESYERYKDNKSNFLNGYFIAICTYTSKYLFDSSNVRVHIRFLKDDKYEKLVAYLGSEEFSKPITTMDSDKGMIFESGKLKRSLIKSLNMEYHLDGKNDNLWQEYITFAFYNLCYNGTPFLSMGISVKNREHYKQFLYFLNYYRIENIILSNVEKINDQCNIIEVIRHTMVLKQKEVI